MECSPLLEKQPYYPTGSHLQPDGDDTKYLSRCQKEEYHGQLTEKTPLAEASGAVVAIVGSLLLLLAAFAFLHALLALHHRCR
jgi:hypothetical protein